MVYYSSKYGTSKKIAEWLAADLKQKAIALEKTDCLETNTVPVIVMPLYAGGFYQAKKAVRLLDQAGCKELILVSVGLSDPNREDTHQVIEEVAKKTFPEKKVHIFSTRGGIDYSALSLKHQMMMWMLKKMVEKKPDEAENGQILETYGQKVDLLDSLDVKRIAREIEASGFQES